MARLKYILLMLAFLLLLPKGSQAQESRENAIGHEFGVEDSLELRPMRGAAVNRSRQSAIRGGKLVPGTIVLVPSGSAEMPLIQEDVSGRANLFLEGVRITRVPSEGLSESDQVAMNRSIEFVNRSYLYLNMKNLRPVSREEFESLDLPPVGYTYMKVINPSNFYRGRFVPVPNVSPLRAVETATRMREGLSDLDRALVIVCRQEQRRNLLRPNLDIPPAPAAQYPVVETRSQSPRDQDRDDLARARSISDIVPRNELEARILAAARNSPERPVPLQALKRMIFFLRHPPSGFSLPNQRRFTIVDYSRPSSEPRMFVIDADAGSTRVMAAAHGLGRGRNTRRDVREFSNRQNSNLPSKGFMLMGGPHTRFETREGLRALSMTGLQPGINDNICTSGCANPRGIVLHEVNYVSDERARRGFEQGNTWGCIGVDRANMGRLRRDLPGSLMLVHSSRDNHIDYAQDRVN